MDTQLMTKFIERFNELLKESGETKAAVCRATGIYKGTLQKYLNMSYSPKMQTVKKIADHFDVNPIWLMGYDVPRDDSNAVVKTITLDENNEKINDRSQAVMAFKAVDIFNQLSDQNQAVALALLSTLLDNQDKAEEN